MIQLREKQLDDQELLSRAKWLTKACDLAKRPVHYQRSS